MAKCLQSNICSCFATFKQWPKHIYTFCKVLAPFLALFILTFIFAMPLFCNSVRNTLLYNKTAIISPSELETKLIKDNEMRLNKAKEYLQFINSTAVLPPMNNITDDFSKNKTAIALVIVTLSRNRIGKKLQQYEPYYLTQVVSKWLWLLSKEEVRLNKKYYVQPFICNVDEDPISYHEAEDIGKVIPIVTRFRNKSSSVRIVNAKHDKVKRRTKEKEDFVFCHNAFLNKNSDYLLVVEDDALPHDDFFIVIFHLLEYHVENKIQRGNVVQNPEHISWVKLYHPEYFSHFVAYEYERVPEWLAMSVLLASILTAVNDRFNIFKGNVYLLFVIFMGYSMLFTVIISRPNLMWFRRFFSPYLYSYYRAPGCCTPGMLYTYQGARLFTDYLNKTMKKHSRYARDQVQDLFVTNSPVKINRYMVQPNLVTHIGLVSSVRVGVDVSRVESKKKK